MHHAFLSHLHIQYGRRRGALLFSTKYIVAGVTRKLLNLHLNRSFTLFLRVVLTQLRKKFDKKVGKKRYDIFTYL